MHKSFYCHFFDKEITGRLIWKLWICQEFCWKLDNLRNMNINVTVASDSVKQVTLLNCFREPTTFNLHATLVFTVWIVLVRLLYRCLLKKRHVEIILIQYLRSAGTEVRSTDTLTTYNLEIIIINGLYSLVFCCIVFYVPFVKNSI